MIAKKSGFSNTIKLDSKIKTLSKNNTAHYTIKENSTDCQMNFEEECKDYKLKGIQIFI